MKRVMGPVLIAALVLLTGTVGAQDGGDDQGELVDLGGGYAITLPDGWDVREDGDVYVLVNGDRLIYVMTPDVVADNFDPAEDADPAELLIAAYQQMSSRTVDPDDVIVETVEGRVVASTEFVPSEHDSLGVSVILEVAPGKFGLMEFHAPVDEYADTVDAAMAIMLTLRENKAGGIGSVTVEPCAVRAAHANVQLHVGPGNNRAIFREMEQGPYISVLGKATAADGALWWRLDTPTGDANELWVADSDVEQQGGCEYVVDVAAPPIIPAMPRPPAPGEEGTDGDEGGVPPPPAGTVACPIVNLSTFTVKGTITGPGGQYGFEVRAGDFVILWVPQGDYNANFGCDGCDGLGGTGVWPCNGVTVIMLSVE